MSVFATIQRENDRRAAARNSRSPCECLECVRNRRAEGLECESPIEKQMALALLDTFHDPKKVRVEAQYSLGRYRYDFALFVEGREKPRVLIECDGAAYHSTFAQQENDRNKDDAAEDFGAPVLRFTGSEIFRHPGQCVRRVVDALHLIQCVTGPHWYDPRSDDGALAAATAAALRGWSSLDSILRAAFLGKL